MTTKRDLLKHLAKIPDDEELFLLRAQDRLAPGLVRYWAGAAQSRGASPAKVKEAKDCAARMEQWPKRKFPD
jgi:hypothetical protein